MRSLRVVRVLALLCCISVILKWSKNVNKRVSKLTCFIDDYRALHARGVAALKARKSVRVLIYECHGHCGGLGDRVRGIVSAFYLAVDSGRVFFIDQSHPLPLNETLVETEYVKWDKAYLALDVRRTSLQLIDVPHVEDTVGYELNSQTPVVQVSVNSLIFTKKIWEKRGWANDWNCKERRPSDLFELVGFTFNKLFHFSPQVIERAENMQAELGLGTSLGEMHEFIGVHARIGGEVKTSNSTVGWSDPVRHNLRDIPLFIDCVQHLALNLTTASRKSGVQVPVTLFSDNEHFKKQARLEFQGFRILENVSLFHTDRSVETDVHTRKIGNIDVFAELLLLSRAMCIVASRSTFSAIAISIQKWSLKHVCFSYFQSCETPSETLMFGD